MKTTNPVDAARIELLLSDLRLPAIKLMWAKLAEQSDKEGWPAARFLAALAEHEIADRGRRRIERHLAEARPPRTMDRLRRPTGAAGSFLRTLAASGSRTTTRCIERSRRAGSASSIGAARGSRRHPACGRPAPRATSLTCTRHAPASGETPRTRRSPRKTAPRC